MQVVSIEKIDMIVDALQRGETVVFPTETTYGLGCDATNQEAVNRVFAIKGRQPDKPFLVVVPDVKTAKEYLEWNDLLQKIADQYWPGPLTVVGKSKGDLKVNGIVANDGTIALRVTAFPWLNSVAEKFGRPVVATSANLAGVSELYDFNEIKNIFSDQENQPDLIVDDGVLPSKTPTTIISVAGDQLKILRQGDVIVDIK